MRSTAVVSTAAALSLAAQAFAQPTLYGVGSNGDLYRLNVSCYAA